LHEPRSETSVVAREIRVEAEPETVAHVAGGGVPDPDPFLVVLSLLMAGSD